jgi:hypothetical protein
MSCIQCAHCSSLLHSSNSRLKPASELDMKGPLQPGNTQDICSTMLEKTSRE